MDLSQRIVLRVPHMEEAIVHRDLVYRHDDGAELTMDVYLPPGLPSDARRPAVLLVHGGPIPAEARPKEWGIFVSYGQLLAASGLVGVTFNHRLYAPTDYARSEMDVQAALAHVRAHAGELHVDAERLGLWAFSGGGPLVSWALRDRPSSVRCLAAFYALLDLRHALPPGAGAEIVEALRRLSPAAYVAERAAGLPLFVARAGRDNALINDAIASFVAAALAGNAPLTFVNHADGRHGFDILDDDARSREIIGKAVAFLQAHLAEGQR
jgi:acetyl esterase/lipase